ncbi:MULTISPECIES: hypothetical protein [unclassified Duganella]|uniref:hypothetical protein n=1 Tax=unclassified Duganella TaxID=2636909 RepID=UPI000E34AE1A|nr:MULTISPECIES: hypothetical protein [unclassified Duganella]RFP14993.1 hypothetical protein D0T23_13455 [Duganella sp. BJB475]RFP31343.1 hypothetical protein D0T21_15835 [Duganella sp. BJB476]
MDKLKAITLLLALGMGGCGGGGGLLDYRYTPHTSATIAGDTYGLAPNNTVLLANNGTEIIAVTGNNHFQFANPVASNAPYNVTLLGNPNGRACTVANGTGTILPDAVDIRSVTVMCNVAAVAMQTYKVGVTVSGLATGGTVSFVDAQGNNLSANNNGLSVFAQSYSPLVVPGASYKVTVANNPAGQTCTLTNNEGTNSNGPGFVDFINVTAVCK